MISAYVRALRLSLILSAVLPIIITLLSRTLTAGDVTATDWATHALLALAVVGALIWLSGRLLRRIRPALDRISEEQTRFLDRLNSRWIPMAIAVSAASSLFLELAVIRWQGSVWEIFAFYKNFGLLSCFAGLGLGYALGRNHQLPLLLALPTLAWQMLLLILLRHGMPDASLKSFMVTPITEQMNMGFDTAADPRTFVAVYFFLAVTMLITALAFIPVGQLCGRLLDRTAPLRAYGFNLLGSLIGVALMVAVSFLWTPPVIWFALIAGALLVFLAFDSIALVVGSMASLVVVTILAWPLSLTNQQIYSPYQLLERGVSYHGLTGIKAAGHFYQHIYDLSPGAVEIHPENKWLAEYYDLAYVLAPGRERVAVIGAGTGNDVAAALRRGVGHVDAIEIDPAIMRIGEVYHPEAPYDSDRVSRIVNDARTFLRSTANTYDLVVYGMLDSHTLLSHASSVRLDSFVYTVDGLRDAKQRLRDGGIVSLSFAVLSDEIGRKLYLMMTDAFDGTAPVCLASMDSSAVIFAQNKEGTLGVDSKLVDGARFRNCSMQYANPAILADVSTDDWPFFYMPRRVYPLSYLGMIGLVLAVSLFLFFTFVSEKPKFNHAAFFFLGAGFMLVETKGITELGLTFGNTWQVIGIVIAAILGMAYCANFAVAKLGLKKPLIPFVLLLGSIGVGLVVAKAGGFPATHSGQLAAVVVLTIPMFFSGIVFSTLLANAHDAAAALATNLLGAMAGGLLEYNSMYFGFQFLYWIAIGLYAAALLSTLMTRRFAAG
jgi:spermidine synthase